MAFDMGDYVDVATRLRMLFTAYPQASITCTEPSVRTVGDRTFLAVTCRIQTNDSTGRHAVASAWEPFPGRTPYTRDSEAMNAETSAVGRACGLLGFGIDKSVASRNEVQARRDAPEAPETGSGARVVSLNRPDGGRPPTEKQVETLKRMMIERGMPTHDMDWGTLTAGQCSEMIGSLKDVPRTK